jgi:hypothetical protein
METTLFISPSNSENLVFNSHVKHYLKIPIQCEGINEYLSASVIALSICNSSYIINDRNDEITLIESEEDGTNQSEYLIYLDHGNYDGEQLMNMILAKFHEANNDYIVYSYSIDENTYKLTMSTETLNRKAVMTFEQKELLGFENDINTLTTSSPLTSTNLMNLHHDLGFYIRSENAKILHKIDQHDVIFYQPINERKFTYIVKQNLDNSSTIMIKDRILNSFDLSITDEEGREIDLNGLYWEIIIKIRTVKIDAKIIEEEKKMKMIEKKENLVKKREVQISERKSYIKGMMTQLTKALAILIKPITLQLDSIDKEISKLNLKK